MTSAPPGVAERRALWCVVIAVLLLKCALTAFVLPHFERSMSSSYGVDRGDFYDRLAKNLLNGDGYRFTPDTAPTMLREPGYPLFLAGISRLGGDYSRGLARFANFVLTSLSALLVAALARRIAPQRAIYLLAPLLFMLHPGVVIAELRVGVEILLTFLLLCFFLLLSRALASGTVRDYLLAGAMLGVVSSVRSTALLFPLGLPLLYLWTRRARADPGAQPRFLTRGIVALYCGCILILTPWIVRNYQLVGSLVPTASVQGTALHSGYYMCTHAGSTKTTAQLDIEAAAVRSEMARQQGYHFRAMYYQLFYDPHDELRFNRFLSSWVLAQYAHSPALLVRCAGENALNFWFRGKDRAATLANLGVQLPYLVLGMFGIVLAAGTADLLVLGPLVLFLAYSFAVYLPILAQARYSIPLVPVLAIGAAVALSETAWRRALRQARFLP